MTLATAPMQVRCRDCRRPLIDQRYAARGTGRVCGGPIRTGRRPALPPSRVSPEVGEGQMELFVVVIVR